MPFRLHTLPITERQRPARRLFSSTRFHRRTADANHQHTAVLPDRFVVDINTDDGIGQRPRLGA